ncbi:hypothetical protein C1645_838982 [Glomus cerebriforme]|uniref:Uncharacterized protein n=1 Tax=Glomus cerebriforme TaxID=658196 RepID=A0A397S6D7_9GLOM|nr:hypothetical protein C1645_838982 [Glomus cerebriforme]
MAIKLYEQNNDNLQEFDKDKLLSILIQNGYHFIEQSDSEDETKPPENTSEWAYDAEKIKNKVTDIEMLEYRVNDNNDKMTQYDDASLTDLNLDYLLNSAEMNLIWPEDLDEIGKSSQSLLGYLTILKARDNTKKQSENFKNAIHKAFHKSLEVLLDPVLSLNNGIDLDLNNEKIWFFSQISIIIANWSEAATYLDEIDRRLAAISRFTELKIFTNGLQSIARLIANEHYNLMKVMVFVTDNLYKENTKNIKNFIKNKDLYSSIKHGIKYMKSVDMKYLKKKSIDNWLQRFIKAFQSTSPSGLKLPKLHLWVYHIIDSI